MVKKTKRYALVIVTANPMKPLRKFIRVSLGKKSKYSVTKGIEKSHPPK